MLSDLGALYTLFSLLILPKSSSLMILILLVKKMGLSNLATLYASYVTGQDLYLGLLYSKSHEIDHFVILHQKAGSSI